MLRRERKYWRINGASFTFACGEFLRLSHFLRSSSSPLNKKVATLCNENVLRQAVEVWVGDISPNGMLASLLETLNQEARA